MDSNGQQWTKMDNNPQCYMHLWCCFICFTFPLLFNISWAKRVYFANKHSFAIDEKCFDLMLLCCVVLCWWDVVMSHSFKEGEWSGPKQRSLEGVGGDETLAAGEAAGGRRLSRGDSCLSRGGREARGRMDGREGRPDFGRSVEPHCCSDCQGDRWSLCWTHLTEP